MFVQQLECIILFGRQQLQHTNGNLQPERANLQNWINIIKNRNKEDIVIAAKFNWDKDEKKDLVHPVSQQR